MQKFAGIFQMQIMENTCFLVRKGLRGGFQFKGLIQQGRKDAFFCRRQYSENQFLHDIFLCRMFRKNTADGLSDLGKLIFEKVSGSEAEADSGNNFFPAGRSADQKYFSRSFQAYIPGKIKACPG